MANIRFTEAARADLRLVRRLGIEAFGLKRADIYADGLRRSVKRLADFPELAPVRSTVGSLIRVLAYGSHVILYEIDARGVHILRIRHGAEDWAGVPTGDEP